MEFWKEQGGRECDGEEKERDKTQTLTQSDRHSDTKGHRQADGQTNRQRWMVRQRNREKQTT